MTTTERIHHAAAGLYHQILSAATTVANPEELARAAVTAFVAAHPLLCQLDQEQQQAYMNITPALLVLHITHGGTTSFEEGVLKMEWLYTDAEALGTDAERFDSPLSVESALAVAYVYEEVGAHDDLVLRKVASFLPLLQRIRRNLVFGRPTYRAGVDAIVVTAKAMLGSNTSRISAGEFAVLWAAMTNTAGLPGALFLFNTADVWRKGSLEKGNLAHCMQLLRADLTKEGKDVDIDPSEHWDWFADKAARELGASRDADGGLPLAAMLDLDEERLYHAGRILKALFCTDSFMEFLHDTAEDVWYNYRAQKLTELSPTIPTLPMEPEPAGESSVLCFEAPKGEELPVRAVAPLPQPLPQPTKPQDGFVVVVIEPPTEVEEAEKDLSAAAKPVAEKPAAAAPVTAAADGQGATVALEEIVVVRTYPTKEKEKDKELVPSTEAKSSKVAATFAILPTHPSPLPPAEPVYMAVNTAEVAGFWTMPTGEIHPVYWADVHARERRLAQERAEQERAHQQRLYEEQQRELTYRRELAAWQHQEALRRAYEWQTAMWRQQRQEQQLYPQQGAHHFPRPHNVVTTCHQQQAQYMPACGYGQGYGSLACGAW